MLGKMMRRVVPPLRPLVLLMVRGLMMRGWVWVLKREMVHRLLLLVLVLKNGILLDELRLLLRCLCLRRLLLEDLHLALLQKLRVLLHAELGRIMELLLDCRARESLSLLLLLLLLMRAGLSGQRDGALKRKRQVLKRLSGASHGHSLSLLLLKLRHRRDLLLPLLLLLIIKMLLILLRMGGVHLRCHRCRVP